MAESILLLIILLIIIAISIGIYLYTQQNTTDDKSFSDRELNLIDKAIENTKPIITMDIDTKLDDGNYVKTDDLTTYSSNIQSNQDKITEITDLRTTGDKGYTATSTGGTDGAGNGDISVGQYQYIMQDITDNPDAKIELKNKVNIANDFNICNETESVCYKFTVDGAENLNIVKTDINPEGLVTDGNGKIFFKNAFELYDDIAANKYNSGSRNLILSMIPDQIKITTKDNQKKIFTHTDWKFHESIEMIDGASTSSITPVAIANYNYLKIQIKTIEGSRDGNDKYYYPYPFTKYSKLAIYKNSNGEVKRYDSSNDELVSITDSGIKTKITNSSSKIDIQTNNPDTDIIHFSSEDLTPVSSYKLVIYQDD